MSVSQETGRRRRRLLRAYRFGCVCGRHVRGNYVLRLSRLQEALFESRGIVPPLDKRKAVCPRCGRTMEQVEEELAKRKAEGIPAWALAR